MLKMLITGDLGVREMSQQTISIIELFAGIGAQVAALKRLNIPFEVVGISEIDKYAIQSYNAINGPTFNYGDITKIPMLDYADLWTYSFPCQDLSVAGKQAGISEGTRSGLLLHVERLLETAVLIGNQPKYLLLENVKALVSKKFKSDFDRWLQKLESLGYNNYWQVLNAKDYGVPQNRERVFVVSIRKDVDTNGYKFPEKIPLTRKLKDVLEPVVDEKYYLTDKQIKSFIKERDKSIEKGNGFCFKPISENDISRALTLKCSGGRKTDTFVEYERTPLKFLNRNGKKTDGDYAFCVDTAQTGGIKENYLLEPQVLTPKRNEYGKAVRKEYEAGNFTDSRHNMTDMQPRADGVTNTLTTVRKDNYLLEPIALDEQNKCLRTDGTVGTLTTDGSSPKHNNRVIENNYRIRKLTPLECWRLMDFTDDEFYAAQLSGVSNSQLYKQAGNSIVVAVLQAIFKELLA